MRRMPLCARPSPGKSGIACAKCMPWPCLRLSWTPRQESPVDRIPGIPSQLAPWQKTSGTFGPFSTPGREISRTWRRRLSTPSSGTRTTTSIRSAWATRGNSLRAPSRGASVFVRLASKRCLGSFAIHARPRAVRSAQCSAPMLCPQRRPSAQPSFGLLPPQASCHDSRLLFFASPLLFQVPLHQESAWEVRAGRRRDVLLGEHRAHVHCHG